MDFTDGYRNYFSTNNKYTYFSGNGFNLRQDLNSFLSKSPEPPVVRSNIHHTPPSLHFENGARKRTTSCPLPTPKNRFERPDPSPVVEEFPDSKYFELKSIDMREETLHILVTGPPHCGKTRFMEVLAKRSLEIKPQNDGGLSLAFKKSFDMFGMKVQANIWYMKNPKEHIKYLKDAFSDKTLALILVYDVTVRKTLLDVREHILGFNRIFGINVPIFLVGNKTAMRTLISNELSMLDWDLLSYSDGQRVKEEYKLADFVECTGETAHGMHDLLFKASTVALGD